MLGKYTTGRELIQREMENERSKMNSVKQTPGGMDSSLPVEEKENCKRTVAESKGSINVIYKGHQTAKNTNASEREIMQKLV